MRSISLHAVYDILRMFTREIVYLLVVGGSWGKSGIFFTDSSRSHFEERVTAKVSMTQERRVYRFRVVLVDSQSFNCTEKAEQVVVISFRASAPQGPLECVVRLTYIHAPHEPPQNKRTMSTNK